MQCANCDFKNMPNAKVCGRCGTTLKFDELNIDVMPPRAPKRGKGFRDFINYLGIRSRDKVADVRVRVKDPMRQLLAEDAPSLNMWAHFLIPGSALHAVKLPTMAWITLGIWLSLLFLAMMSLGLSISGTFIGLAFSLHYMMNLRAARRGGFQGFYLFRLGAMIFIWIFFLVYVPAYLVFTEFVGGMQINRYFAGLNDGDGVVYFPRQSLSGMRSGNWVLFELDRNVQVNIDTARHAYMNVYPGLYYSQIIAVAGDRVDWDGKKLLVNGLPSQWQPDVTSNQKSQSVTVREKQAMVIPWSRLAQNNYNLPVANQGGQARVDLNDPFHYVDDRMVRGRLVLKLHPIFEMKLLR
jgi:hypothetical protein